MCATWFSSIQFHRRASERKKRVRGRIKSRLLKNYPLRVSIFDAAPNHRRWGAVDKTEFGFAYGENKLIIGSDSDANILTDAWCLLHHRARRERLSAGWGAHKKNIKINAYNSILRCICARRPRWAMNSYELIESVCRSRAPNSLQRRRASATAQQRDRRHHIRRLPLIKCSSSAHALG